MKIPVAPLLLVLLGTSIASIGQPAGLHGTIGDEATGALTPCTVKITDANGNVVVENGSFKAGFRCGGEFTKRLPAGVAVVHVSHGFETQFVEEKIELEAGRQAELNIKLGRNIDLRQRGWYAGDSHVHMLHGERTVPVTFDTVALTAQAEGLQYLSLAQAWELETPTPEALEAQLGPRSSPDCGPTWNLEAPKNYYKGDAGRCLGHCWNLGMRGRTSNGVDVIHTLLEASAWDYESEKPSYANFESHRLIHAQGGAVFYTHPARWWTGAWGGKGGYSKVDQMRISNMAVELPLDTVLGPTFDGLDVITGPGEQEANEKAFQLWSMLLNHGYRLAATGSSDACFDRPGGGVPGMPRTYTFVPRGFSLSKVAAATAAGQTFVTTGPLLIATIDGKPPGSSFKFGKKHNLAIEAWASGESTNGLNKLELRRNGQPVRQWVFPNEPRWVQLTIPIEEKQTSWYCLRLWQAGAGNKRAITSAFYFGKGRYRPPPAVSAHVHAKLIDQTSGARLAGSLTELDYYGTLAQERKRYSLKTGEARLTIPGTLRLRAEADGYVPVVLSPVLDNPQLMNMITGLSDAGLLDWETFERVREHFSHVELVFKLQKKAP